MDEEQTIELVLDEITNYIHGPARDHIVQSFQQQTEELGETIAALAYRIVRESIDKVEGEGPVDFDFVLAVATETIDMLIEIADALGIQYDPDKIREESLLRMTAIHMEQVGDDPEQKAIAKAALEEMMVDGTYERAMGVTQNLMQKHGANPAMAAEMGEQMVTQRQKPLSEAVSQNARGLMG